MRQRTVPAEFNSSDRKFVVALARGLEILRAFRQDGELLGNKDLAQRSGLSKSTVSRLTYTLCKLGYLHYLQDTARYRLAPPVLSLGFACLASLPVRELALPMMRELAAYSGLPVALAARDRTSMVYVERVRSPNPVTLAVEVGAHIKLATSALGRAYIAGLCQDEREAVFEELAEHEGASWPSIRNGIERALECYEKHGFCTSIGEWKVGVNSVAVPFVPSDGSPVLAFNVGGPADQLPFELIFSDMGSRLVEIAKRVGSKR